MNNKNTNTQNTKSDNTFATIMHNTLAKTQRTKEETTHEINSHKITPSDATQPKQKNKEDYLQIQYPKEQYQDEQKGATTSKQQGINHIQNRKQNVIYVSVGDINGVGLELILRNHDSIVKWCTPIYCVSRTLLEHAAQLLDITLPDNIQTHDIGIEDITIRPGEITAKSGYYSFVSFSKAVELSLLHNVALVTLPIHKYAWNLAGIQHIGHTQYLRHRFQRDAIMMLGCEELFVALYTDHIPLQNVPEKIQKEPFLHFLRNFYYSFIIAQMPKEITKKTHENINTEKNSLSLQYDEKDALNIPLLDQIAQVNAIKQYALNAKMVKRLLHDPLSQQIVSLAIPNHLESNKHNTQNLSTNHTHYKGVPEIAVLGLNPHAGDNGLLGKEDFVIKECIELVNAEIGKPVFVGPLAPDSAFIPSNRKKYKIFIAMYHDSGLTPLKALYFDKSINVSLNLPILRTSPDHGTCFDRAYKKDSHINMQSYLESFKFIFHYWDMQKN